MILCADIGGSYIDFATADDAHILGSRRRCPTPVNDLAAFGHALEEFVSPYDTSISLHVAIAGVCDSRTGYTKSANIPCVNNLPLRDLLARQLNRQVVIGNDAHCFALAEAMQGAGRGHDGVFGIILGTGVGGGLVIDGKLIVGKGGLGGEWGHAPFIEQTSDTSVAPVFRCRCGQSGCLDTIGGARGIERMHQVFTGQDVDSRSILSQWEQGDVAAQHTIGVWLDRLSAALAMIVNITGVTVMPVGGGLAHQKNLISALDGFVRRRTLRDEPEGLVIPGCLPADSGLVGASWLGADHDLKISA